MRFEILFRTYQAAQQNWSEMNNLIFLKIMSGVMNPKF